MTRPLRIRFAAALYRVTAQGNHCQPIDRDHRDRERSLDRLADGRVRAVRKASTQVVARRRAAGRVGRALEQLTSSFKA